MHDRYKTFPPGWNNILLPTHRRRATLAGMATYTPCLPKGVWGQRVAWTLVSIGGARVLPGRSSSWEPPLPLAEWDAFISKLGETVGRFDSHTVYERRRGRQGLLMLLLDGDRPVGFVKARKGVSPELDREQEALELAEAGDVSSFVTPRVLESGDASGWRFLVLSPMPPKMHRMLKTPPSPQVLDDIHTILSGLDKPNDMPDSWEPFHGDFAPWNLRHIGGATPWLIDWEDAGWAPPEADRVFYIATAAAMGVPVSDERFGDTPAVRYWWAEVNRRIEERPADLPMRPLDYGLLEAFAAGKG